MSTTTTPGGLLRRAGTLLVAAALVAAPATSAFAEPTPTETASPAVTVSPSPTASASTTSSAATTPSTASPSPSETASGGGTATPGPSASQTTTSSGATGTSPSPSAALKAGLATPAAEAAADFIARTLSAGDDHYVYPGGTYFDGGNTIDAIVALSAAGTQQAQADASLAYLESNLEAYIGAGGEVYAGALAKSLLGVLVAGSDPRSFADTDLVAELQALETTQGRFSDASTYGDYSNTIGQALAVIALSRAGEGLTAASVEVLLDQQCDDGGFRGSLEGDSCTSDADATAFAIQALLAAGRTLLCGTGSDALPARAAASAGAGLDWLEDQQDASGGLESTDGVLNANTTGVAAQAFLAAGRTSAADTAVGFITTLQYDAASPEPLRGGIAFSAATRSTTVPSDSDLRATPQATLALLQTSLLDAVAPGVETPAPSTTCPPVPTREPVTVPEPSTPSSPSTPVTPNAPTAGPGNGTDGAGGNGGADPVAGSPSGSLAQTGSDLLLPVGLGLLLVVVGSAAVLASRRRGAHL